MKLVKKWGFKHHFYNCKIVVARPSIVVNYWMRKQVVQVESSHFWPESGQEFVQKLAELSAELLPYFASQLLFSLQCCFNFASNSTELFLIIETELTLDQNIRLVTFWVSFPMHQESPHLDLCRLKNYWNILNYSMPYFSFDHRNWLL